MSVYLNSRLQIYEAKPDRTGRRNKVPTVVTSTRYSQWLLEQVDRKVTKGTEDVNNAVNCLDFTDIY